MKHRSELEEFHDLSKIKPITYTGKVYMQLQITWANETHSDCDNVFKGIADALFMNDKHLVGCFDYKHGDKIDGGQVVVTITFL